MSTTKRWSILLVMAVMVALSQFDKNAIAVAAVPISKELGFSATQMGLVISCFFLSYTGMNVVGGYIADIYGARKVAMVSTLLFSCFTGITGFAWSFNSVLAIRFIFGAGEGAFPPTLGLAVAELFPVGKRAFSKSFITGASMAGVGLGAIAVTQISQHFGWRTAFFLYCGMGFILCTIFAYVSRGMRAGKTASSQNKGIDCSAVFKAPLIWKIIPIQFASGAFFWGLNSWMPSYWMNVKGLKLVSMGFAAAIPAVISALVMFYMGYALDKYFGGKEKRVIAISALCAGLFIFLTFIASTVTLGIASMTIASICAGIMTQTNQICILKYFPENTIGAGAGIGNAASQLAGIVTPAIMGYIITATGGNYAAVFGFVVLMLLVAFLIALTMNTRKIAAQVATNNA